MKSRLRAKRLRAFVAVLCTLALVMMPVLPAWGDTTSGVMVASDQTWKSVDPQNNIKRIDSFKLDNTYSYKSLGNDPGKATLTLSTSALQDIVKDKLLPQWSGVAASVFRDQAGQLVDLYGYQPNGGNMSKAGFDAYFNMNNGPKDYKDEIWSCYSLKSKLQQTWATHSGDPGWDQLTVSGVKQVNSLSQAREMVGKALYDCENHKGLKASEFLGVDEGGNTRLDALESDEQTTAFANLVTSVNCKGSSADFDYVSFGIVFYDFQPVPVAAQGLTYQDTGLHKEENQKGQNDSTITNGQQQEIVHSAALGDSVTETTTTTLSALASAKMSQNIGANMSWSETEFSSETNPTEGDDGGSGGSETSGSASTTTMGLNWGAAWELAGAAGAEVGHSQSKQVSKAVETTISIPPHTAATINSTTTSTTYTQEYQQPVILNYKVAIFAVSGDFYSGGSGGINSGSYDKQSLVIKFDTKGETNPSYGCAATDDLYSRAITNVNVNDYDISGGRTYSTHSTASGWSKSENIDWASVINDASNHYNVDLVNDVAKKNFFYETPGKLNVEQDKTTSAVKETVPLYNLASVTTPKTDFTLYSGNTLDLKSLTLTGLNKSGVPFYSFNPSWGEWQLCNDKGEVRTEQMPTTNDPIKSQTFTDTKTLEPVGNFSENTNSTIYLKWVPKADSKPTTLESPGGQDLSQDYGAKKITTPVISVLVKNAGLDNPTVTATGSYTGLYSNQINLNNVMTYEVRDSTNKKVDTQVKWESDEFVREGIGVSNDTGYVVFTKPGTYHVRAYVMKNASTEGAAPEKAYSDWITITATEHDLVHYDAKAPTDCTGGDANGYIEHYRCSACGKFFSDAEGTNEIPEADVIIEAPGHDWGEWVTTKEATNTEPGVQQRVCKNRASHVETRNLYMVEFDTNKPEIATDVPDPEAVADQTVVSGGSVAVPAAPAIAGFTFEGWYKDTEGNNLYDFSSSVDSNMKLYAKWSRTNFTVASTAIVYIAGSDGEQKILPAKDCYVSVKANDVDGRSISDEEGYSYRYMDVKPGDTVTLTVNPATGDKYSFSDDVKNIQAVQVNSNLSTASADLSATNSVPLTKTGDRTYTFTMPAADVAIVANFNQDKVTVTYDENKPANAPENATVSDVPAAMTINNGSSLTLPTTNPTLSWTTGEEGSTATVYRYFDGWYTDQACTKPFLSGSKITQDMTLYAKWAEQSVTKYDVTYTLYDVAGADPSSYSYSYQAEENSTAYDPTNDLYAYAGTDLLKAYDLYKDGSGNSWFTDAKCKTPYNFETKVSGTLNLYAKVVDKTYTVTYYDGERALGTQSITYNTESTAIGTVGSDINTTKDGCTLSGWVTKDGNEWKVESDSVTGDLALYATWNIDVTFDANGHGTAPAVQTVKSGGKVTKPSDLTAEGYTFGGWYTDAACSDDKAYNFDTSVTEPLTLYAKWTANDCAVTFDANGHGTAPDAQTVKYDDKVTEPAAPTADGYTFGGWYTDAACTKAYDFAAPVTGDLKLYAKWTEAPAPAPTPDPVSEGVEMYRLYNPNSGEHFYTGNAGERDAVVAAGWSYEGVGWTAPTTSNTPVYRLYNANGGEHHYTMSAVERDMLVGVGWSYEDIGWYSDDEQRVPLYRDYNPYAFANNHNYTTSAAEHDMLMGVGWRPEGYAWYAIK